jgi:hypothetical protein
VLRFKGRRLVSPPAGPLAVGTAGLRKPGSALLEIAPDPYEHVSPRRGGRVRVDVVACDPVSGAAASRHLRVRVSRRPVPPLAIPFDVRARRAGGDILVRWQTDRPARRTSFTAIGRRRRKVSTPFDAQAYGFAYAEGRGRRSLSVRLRPRHPRRVRYVVLTATADDPPQRSRRLVVRVSG